MDRRTFLTLPVMTWLPANLPGRLPGSLLAHGSPGRGSSLVDTGQTPAHGAQSSSSSPAAASAKADVDLRTIERARVLAAADRYLRDAPITVTAARSPRSAGGAHDYFSEGDYWWPDPASADAPYIQKDGLTNPDNFTAHRAALIRLSLIVPALAAAWMLTGRREYADHAARHLRAWFVEPDTRMNPNLLYAQAIKGRFTGRGIGIIDTLHLVEVARAISRLEEGGVLPAATASPVRAWFAAYLRWMTTHDYGNAEREALNNHGTCWVVQVAEFARYTADDGLSGFCRQRYKTVLLPTQVAADGSFPLELRRTKPYGYSRFNLDAMGMVCQILSAPAAAGSPGENLWRYTLEDGRGMASVLAYMAPFIADKSRWPKPPDVMYFDGWPVRHPSLLFGGLALAQGAYVDLWRRLDPDPTVEEIVRNYPVRQPLLWV